MFSEKNELGARNARGGFTNDVVTAIPTSPEVRRPTTRRHWP